MAGTKNNSSLTSEIIFSLLWILAKGNLIGQSDSLKPSSADSLSIIDEQLIQFISGNDADSQIEEQEQSSFLQSGRNAFTKYALFQFTSGRYKRRGYPIQSQLVLFNGMNVSNLETGYSAWNQWGGLNDISRNAEFRYGNISCPYGFSGPAGFVNIEAKSSAFRKGTKLTYSIGNRLFRHRFMISHSTGLINNSWSITFSASGRYGNEVSVPGTYYTSRAFFFSFDKLIGKKQTINFTAMSVYTEQGRSSAELMETRLLSTDNNYNSLWGLQNGRRRNAQVSQINRPIIQVNHTFQFNLKSKLSTSILYTFGKSGLTGINWADGASNPKPDYYKNLASYYYDNGDTVGGDLKKEEWKSNFNTSQLNWDLMIASNQNNFYTPPLQIGQSYNTQECRARYILENKIESLKNFGINSVYSLRKERVFLSAGITANFYQNRKYKIIADLLGAHFWMDYDQFAEQLTVSNDYKQNDLEHPDKKIYLFDKFGYDYSICINRIETWAQAEYNANKVDFYAGFLLGNSMAWREGYLANGKFPLSSKGAGAKQHFLNWGIKSGLTLKLTGRHFVSANLCLLNKAPQINHIFVSPSVRNDIISGLKNERVNSIDLSYHMNYPGFKISFTSYYTSINHQTRLRTFWSDEFNNNVNLILKNMNQQFSGIEIGIEKSIFTQHTLDFAFGIGQFIYSNRPNIEAWQDNNNQQLYSNRTAYIQNYYIGGSPQCVLGSGYRYNARKNWFVGISINFFAKNYSEINPDRRTEQALIKYLDSEYEQFSNIIKQEQLPSYYLLNAHMGKYFRISNQRFLNLNLVIFNLLNRRGQITGGYEQLRWDTNQINRFANKYFVMQGITFMFNVSFTFR